MFQSEALNTNWNRCSAHWINENEKISIVSVCVGKFHLLSRLCACTYTVLRSKAYAGKPIQEGRVVSEKRQFSRLATVWRKQYRGLLQEKPIFSPFPIPQKPFACPQNLHLYKFPKNVRWEDFQLRQRNSCWKYWKSIRNMWEPRR